MNKQLVVFIGCTIQDNKVLLVQRAEKECPDAHLKWELPGGKAEFGESAQEAIVREIKEETGCDVETIELFPLLQTIYWKFDWGEQQTFIICYTCKLIKENPVEKPDHHVAQIKWVPIQETSKFNLLNGTSLILKQLREKSRS